MGMSASQARLLSITSRMNDIEFKSQQVANIKMRLAAESEQVATDYTNALNKQKLTFTTYQQEGAVGQAVKVSLTPDNLSEFGFALVNTSTNEVFSGSVSASQMYEMIESGEYILKQGGETYTETYTMKIIPPSGSRGLMPGIKTVTKEYYEGGNDVSVSGNTQLAIESDTTDLARAEATYNEKTLKINNKEKKLDMEMKALDTEHSALKTEFDSVKQLIGDNVDKSFNLFS